MSLVNWLATERSLSPVMMTVRAQAIPPNDTGKLAWDIFFPRQNVPSVDLQDILTLDYRPTADRREWNARGREIPLATPLIRPVSIVPIESKHVIGEQEMQRINERAITPNDEIFRRIIGSSIPDRVDMLVNADYRRLEVDAMKAWATGSITQVDPEDASKTVASSFGFSSSRYTTAATPWNDPSINGYDAFLAWVVAGLDLVGPTEGAVMRLATFNAILADAPDLPNGVAMTRMDVQDRMQRDLGFPFQIFINENSVDLFNDSTSALAYSRTKLWTAQKVALIPAGRTVGYTAFAPVVRAMELVAQVGDAPGIDVRGVTVYYDEGNGGRTLSIEAQVNALPVPDEQRCYVIDAGV